MNDELDVELDSKTSAFIDSMKCLGWNVLKMYDCSSFYDICLYKPRNSWELHVDFCQCITDEDHVIRIIPNNENPGTIDDIFNKNDILEYRLEDIDNAINALEVFINDIQNIDAELSGVINEYRLKKSWTL